MKGHTYKRCPCGTVLDADGKRVNCPKKHGTWQYVHELPSTLDGRRRQSKVSGFATEREARQALTEAIDGLRRGTFVETSKQRVAEYLDQWMAGKTALRSSTRLSYAQSIALYLKPGIGHLRIRDLQYTHIEDLYAAMRCLGRPIEGRPNEILTRLLEVRRPEAKVRPLSDARIRRVHATLMSALNSAVKRRLMGSNPGQYVELPSGGRPRAVVWTDEQVRAWQRTGSAPSVAVWTAAQTGQFLDSAADDRLYPLFHLIAYRGLRRGEAVGLRWQDVDLDAGTLVVSQQIVQLGWKTEIGDPKTGSGIRTVPLDQGTVAVLRRWRAAQSEEKRVGGEGWQDTGFVFTRPDGQVIHPDLATDGFRRLSRRAELPPIRLHDLRHTAASLALAAGVPMKVVSELLGHSSLALTADTYTSVLPAVAHAAAEAVFQIVPRAVRQPVSEESSARLDDGGVAIPLPFGQSAGSNDTSEKP